MAAADTKIGKDCAVMTYDGAVLLAVFENCRIGRHVETVNCRSVKERYDFHRARSENWDLEVTIMKREADLLGTKWPGFTTADPLLFVVQPYDTSGQISAYFVLSDDELNIDNDPQKHTYRFALADATPNWANTA